MESNESIKSISYDVKKSFLFFKKISDRQAKVRGSIKLTKYNRDLYLKHIGRIESEVKSNSLTDEGTRVTKKHYRLFFNIGNGTVMESKILLKFRWSRKQKMDFLSVHVDDWRRVNGN